MLLLWLQQCDETRPVCRRCRAYGVSCTYTATGPLQAAVERVVTLARPVALSCWVDQADYLLSRFQMRTAGTVSHGRPRQVFQNDVVQLAHSVPSTSPSVGVLADETRSLT